MKRRKPHPCKILLTIKRDVAGYVRIDMGDVHTSWLRTESAAFNDLEFKKCS